LPAGAAGRPLAALGLSRTGHRGAPTALDRRGRGVRDGSRRRRRRLGYWIVLPPAIHFLTNYDSSHYTILIRARDYYRFATFVLLGVAIAFEVPVFVLALVRLRILSAAQLRRTWRVGIFVMTAIGVALPGVDPVSTTLSVVPLVSLYVLAIGLASFLEPRWRSRTGTAPVPE